MGRAVAGQDGDWDDVFVYFKHEDEGKGPEFAAAFVPMTDPERAAAPGSPGLTRRQEVARAVVSAQ